MDYHAKTFDIFRARLADLRKSRGITQRELAVRLGLNGLYISQIETGFRQPTLRFVLSVCREFRVTPNDLLQP